MDLKQVIAWCLGFKLFFVPFKNTFSSSFSSSCCVFLMQPFTWTFTREGLPWRAGQDAHRVSCSLWRALAKGKWWLRRPAKVSIAGDLWRYQLLSVLWVLCFYLSSLCLWIALLLWSSGVWAFFSFFLFIACSSISEHPWLDHRYPVHLTSSGCAPLCL